MGPSEKQPEECLVAAVADLKELGVSFSEVPRDCGSDSCPHCTSRRTTKTTVDSGAEKYDVSQQIDSLTEEEDLEGCLDQETAKEMDSMNKTLWADAEEELPDLLRCNNQPTESNEDCEMVNMDEAQIGLAEIDEEQVVKGSTGDFAVINIRR